MTAPIETSTPGPLEAFTDYRKEFQRRLVASSHVLEDGLLIVEDPNIVNLYLREKDRADLTIDGPAEMMPVAHPLDVLESCNNFIPNFRFRAGIHDTGETDADDWPILKIIPPAEEDILALRTMPKVESREQIMELEKSGEFPAFSGDNHSAKPAFARLLMLFPEFTTKFVVDFSAPETQHRFSRFEPELFVAYQLMSKLVDVSDLYVNNEYAGQPDDWYLCR